MRDSNDDRDGLGMGIMTIISVMDTALTNAQESASRQKGAALILDDDLIGLGMPRRIKTGAEQSNCIDWIFSDLPLSNEIADIAGRSTASADVLLRKLDLYCKEEPIVCVAGQFNNSLDTGKKSGLYCFFYSYFQYILKRRLPKLAMFGRRARPLRRIR